MQDERGNQCILLQKTGSACTCGCSCGTCRDWLGRFNSGLAGYYLKELMEDPSKLEDFESTQVGEMVYR